MKYIKDWERILLDTTTFCSLFRSEKSTLDNSQDLFVRKLIDFLVKDKTSNGDERTFLISSITVAELITNEEDSEKIKRMMRILDSKNIEFVDFDLDVSLAFNAKLKPLLNKRKLHEKAIEVGFKSEDFAMAREWITKDYMIAMCGIVNSADVILTADKNTFYPIIKDISNANCVLTYSELFEQGEKVILGYKEKEVENFLKMKIDKESTKKTPQEASSTFSEIMKASESGNPKPKVKKEKK